MQQTVFNPEAKATRLLQANFELYQQLLIAAEVNCFAMQHFDPMHLHAILQAHDYLNERAHSLRSRFGEIFTPTFKEQS